MTAEDSPPPAAAPLYERTLQDAIDRFWKPAEDHGAVPPIFHRTIEAAFEDAIQTFPDALQMLGELATLAPEVPNLCLEFGRRQITTWLDLARRIGFRVMFDLTDTPGNEVWEESNYRAALAAEARGQSIVVEEEGPSE